MRNRPQRQHTLSKVLGLLGVGLGSGTLEFGAGSELLMGLLALRLLCFHIANVCVFLFQPSSHFL